MSENSEDELRSARRQRSRITLTRLVEVSRRIGELSLESRTERFTKWDFERAADYVREQGLETHIRFVSLAARDKRLPLNSERHVYDMENIVVRDLEIELDDKTGWDRDGDWVPVSRAKWHFDRCGFRCPSPNGWVFVFPWRGAFRFRSNEFSTPSDRFAGHWTLAFEAGSRAWFGGNDFGGGHVQTECVRRAKANTEGEDSSTDHAWEGSGQIAFVGNRGLESLEIFEGYSAIEITGMNRIGRFNARLKVDGGEEKRTSVYLGPREKIDPGFHHCLQHRSLFLAMRQLAATSHDGRQLTVLDRQLERIEYFLNKGQDRPSVKHYGVWVEYWQDRVLFGWRRWSSDFYRSWLRPLVTLVIGYLLINAVPALVVEPFGLFDWVALTLRPIGEIATYEASVGRIVGNEYESVAGSARTLLKLMGLVEVVWMGVWGFAFAKAIRR